MGFLTKQLAGTDRGKGQARVIKTSFRDKDHCYSCDGLRSNLPWQKQITMLATPHPTRLTVLRVQLIPTAAQHPLLENLFALQRHISQLFISHGTPEATEHGASQFALHYRKDIEHELEHVQNASVDQLTAVVLERARATHDVLRHVMPGTVCVARDRVSLPIRTLGPVRLGGQLEEINKIARSHCLLENYCVLFYDSGQFEVELQWWRPSKRVTDPSPGGQDKLRNSVSKTPPSARNTLPLQPKRTEKSPSTRAKHQSKLGKSSHKTSAATKEKIAEPTKNQQVRGWASSNTQLLNSNSVTRRGKTSARKGRPAFSGKHMPPQNFASPAKAVPMITVDCSCLGNNASCYRCDGRGYYERAAAVTSSPSPSNSRTQVASIVRYEKDSRGGEYAIRENGRFLSNALHDIYDDESGA
jgi:hypothetical protein